MTYTAICKLGRKAVGRKSEERSCNLSSKATKDGGQRTKQNPDTTKSKASMVEILITVRNSWINYGDKTETLLYYINTSYLAILAQLHVEAG